MLEGNINCNYIAITNKWGKLRCRCPYSEKKGGICFNWRYYSTRGWVNYSLAALILNVYPTIICNHGYICDPYFYHYKEDVGAKPKYPGYYNKLYLNKKGGDNLENGPEFYTLTAWWNGQGADPLSRPKQRYYIDSKLLTRLNQSQLIQCMYSIMFLICF